MEPKKQNGGSREGAGRKPSEFKTVVVAFRVKEDQAEPVRKLVKEYLKTIKSSK